MSHTKALHFMGRHTHDKRLTCANFVVAYSTTVLDQHPNGILLRFIGTVNVLLSLQTLEIKVWECLMATVIVGTNETIKLTVIHIRKILLPLLVMAVNPLRESITDGINLTCGKLHSLMVSTLDRVTVRLIAYHLLNRRDGIIKGMTQNL